MSAPILLKALLSETVGVTSAQAFASRFPSHAFVVTEADADPGQDKPPAGFATVMFNKKALASMRPEDEAKVTPLSMVHWLVKGGRNPFGFVAIGRARNNDVALPFASVSKFHASLHLPGGSDLPAIEDANTTNGTWVNGERLVKDQKRQLRPGDVVTFGASVVALYLDPAELFSLLGRLRARFG